MHTFLMPYIIVYYYSNWLNVIEMLTYFNVSHEITKTIWKVVNQGRLRAA